MSMNDPYLIDFKLQGPGLENNVNLYELISSFSEFHSILDKTYAVINGQQRLSKDDREKFQVRASDFRQGSFITTLEIIVTGTQLALPLLGLSNPYTIWEYTKSSFELLKAIYTARQKGNEPTIQIGDNSKAVIILGDDNKLNIEDTKIIEIANRSKRNYAKLANTLDERGINQIQIAPLNSSDNKAITIDIEEKTLFEIPTLIMPKPVSFYADIFDFNKETNSGRLRVLRGQSVPNGVYNFSIIGGQDNNKYIESMLHSAVEVTALKEQEFDPIEGPKLIRFQIIQIDFAS